MRFLVLTVAFLNTLVAQPAAYDAVILGGRVIDGSGSPWYYADIGIRGDSIAAIGDLKSAIAPLKIDAHSLVVAPGFLDIHTHARRGIFRDPAAQNYIRQGVTTLLEGNDGSSPIPLAPFLKSLRETRLGVNFGTFAGQGRARQKVIGLDDRRATPEEVQAMRELVRQAMLDGTFGLSTGLFYVPGNFTPTEEVIDLAKVAGAMTRLNATETQKQPHNSASVLRYSALFLSDANRGKISVSC